MNAKTKYIISIIAFTMFMYTGNVHAYVFKEIKQIKDDFAEKGLLFEASYLGEVMANTRGGTKRDNAYLDNLDLTFSFDTQKFGLWDHGIFHIHILHNGGSKKITGDIVENLQVISNIEAPRATRVYQLWYEHSFHDESFFALFGIHDFNADFDVSEYSGLYLNDAHGTQRDITAAGRPSVFPIAGPAIRLKYIPHNQWEMLFGVYDGDPDDPDNVENFPRSDLDSNGGAFIATEFAYHLNTDSNHLPGFVKLGFWYNSGNFDDLIDVDAAGDPIKRDGNYGGYFIIDKALYQESPDDNQGLGAFFRFGMVPTHINEIDLYFAYGLNYLGLIPGRDSDETGVSVSYGRLSDDLVDAGGRDKNETVIEITYKAHICDGFSLQPDFQYIFNPGATDALENAFVAGIRFELSF